MIAIVGLLLALTVSQTQEATPSTARVSGQVTAAGSNAPIAGARVVLYPARPRMGTFTPPGEAMTDADGRFAFDRLAGGSYNIGVQKTGYVSYPGTPGRSQTIQVEAGQALANVNVQLQKGGTIVGRLLDASGQPLTDASVNALRLATVGGSRERYVPAAGGQQTNDIGEFRLPGLAPGDYIVVASPRGQFPFGGPGMPPPAATAPAPRTTPIATYYPGTNDQATAQTIHVSAEQTVENIVFTMLSAAAFRISGVVVDESGSPVPGAMVMLMHDPRNGAFPPLGPSGGARTQADGTFAMTAVPAGTYRLTASVPVTVSSTTGRARSSDAVTTWSASGGSGSVTTWSTSGGGAGSSGGIVGATSVAIGPGAMPTATEVAVADADVAGVRVVVKR